MAGLPFLAVFVSPYLGEGRSRSRMGCRMYAGQWIPLGRVEHDDMEYAHGR